MPNPRLVPSGNPPVSAEEIFEKIHKVLNEIGKRVWFGFSENFPVNKYIHISRHGEYLFMNRCKRNNSCIQSLNKTMANEGRRWVHEELTYGTEFFEKVFLALNSNALYRLVGVNCHYRDHFHDSRMFIKLSMEDYLSIIPQITISESDWENDVRGGWDYRSLKKESIERIEQACKRILNL